MEGLILYARDIEERPAENLIVLTGEPEAVAGTDRLTAERITIEQTTQVITAEGNVVIRRPTGTIYATKAVYDYGAGTGTATSGNTIFGNYRIQAEEIRLLPGPAYHALRAKLTTCFEEKPHYEIYTRELELYPGDKLIAHHIGIDLLNRRLITIPRYTKSLKEGTGEEEEKSLYPSFGYASRLGFYASKDFSLRRSSPAWVDGYVQINTFHEPTIGVQAATPGRLQWVGALFYRDIAENQRVPLLQVTRLPEVGLVWSPRRGVPRPGQFLAHQVSNVRAPRPLEWVGRDWIPSAQVSLGFFRQHHGQETIGPQSQSKNGFRGVLQAQAVKPVVKLGPLTLNDLRLLARGSIYDNGDRLAVLGTGIGKRYKLGRWELKLRRFDQWTSGRTPFLFDDVELRQEWRPQVEYHSRTFNFSYTARLRNGGGVFDQIFSVSKLFHCIEPQITYRTRRNLFMLEVRIPGFSGFGRSRADEPGALDVDQAGRAASPIPPTVERP